MTRHIYWSDTIDLDVLWLNLDERLIQIQQLPQLSVNNTLATILKCVPELSIRKEHEYNVEFQLNVCEAQRNNVKMKKQWNLIVFTKVTVDEGARVKLEWLQF